MAITYAPTTNFGLKDSLPTNDSDKVIRGSEFTTEFTAIQTAFSLAAPNASPTFTGTVTIPTADINGGAIDGTTIGGTTPAAATFTSVTATTADINGGAIDGTVIGAATPAAGSFTTVSATGNITVGGTVDGRDVAADGTKLDGIEAGADVTDTTNVTAAGALMDSELTNIAAVKTLNQGVATTDSPSFAGLTATGSVSLAGASTTADVTFGDNDKAIFGAGSDLQIYSDGASGVIQQSGTGVLLLKGQDFYVQNDAGANYIRAEGSAQVDLYYGGAKKFETTATGIDVTGTVTADGLTLGQSHVLDFQSGAGEKILSPAVGVLSLASRGNIDIYVDTNNNDASSAAEFSIYKSADVGVATAKILSATKEGDISFYEDTGTTPKFFWDASAEALGIGGSTITDSNLLNIQGSSASVNIGVVFNDTNTSKIFGIQNGGSALKFFDYSATAERMRIDSSGNVGIGTTSPSTKLHLSGTGNTALKIEDNSGVAYLDFTTSAGTQRILGGTGGTNNLLFYTGLSEAMRIDSSGKVGIGTSSPAFNLTTQGSSGTVTVASKNTGGNATVYIEASNTNTAKLELAEAGTGSYSLQVGNDDALMFFDDSSERMRINSSGNLLVGTTTPGEGISYGASGVTTIKGVYGAMIKSTGGVGYEALSLWNETTSGTIYQILFRDGASGGVRGSVTTNGSTTAYNTSSDYRLKDVDGPITNSGAYIDALKPVQGSWKADGSRFIGLIAHEVQEVSETQIATGEKDGEEMQGMDYSAPELIANLIAEIQSLRARVHALESK